MSRTLVTALPLALLVGCSGLIDPGDVDPKDDDSRQVFSPDDPTEFSLAMFDESELEKYSSAERAYIQGHALGIYLYGKTLPTYIGHKGFLYRPGQSAASARYAYDWDDVMIAVSGGYDGYGWDDVGQGGDDDGDGDGDGDGGTCSPFDDVCGGDGDDDGGGSGGGLDDDGDGFDEDFDGKVDEDYDGEGDGNGDGDPDDDGDGKVDENWDGDGDGNDDDGDGMVDEDWDGDGDGADDDHDGDVDEDCDEFCSDWDGDGDGVDDDGDGTVDENFDGDGDGNDDDGDGKVDEDWDGDGDGKDDDGDGDVDENWDGDGDGDDDDGDGKVDEDEDCEDFLDPAALEARASGIDIVLDRVLGTLTALDGDTQAAFEQGFDDSLSLQDREESTDHAEPEHLKDDVQESGLCTHSPLVLDMRGDGLEISRAGKGVVFDLFGRGSRVQTAWPQADDALLAIDLDGDGAITSGRELFGNTEHADGFASLARFDSVTEGGNADGFIDNHDDVFERLMVWTDGDRDGLSGASELTPLADAGVVSIDLGYQASSLVDPAGNQHKQRATFVMKDGSGYAARDIVDVWFRYRKK